LQERVDLIVASILIEENSTGGNRLVGGDGRTFWRGLIVLKKSGEAGHAEVVANLQRQDSNLFAAV